MLVEVAAGEDDHVAQTRSVEHCARGFRVSREIAAVEPHARDPDALGLQRRIELDHPGHRRLGVVGVDQHHRPRRPRAGEILERLALAAMRLDERVRHRAEHRNAVLQAGLGGRAAVEAGQPGRPRREQRGLGAVGAAHAEVDQLAPAPREDDARGLRGDQRLQVDDVQQAALGELRLRQGRGHAKDRFVGEEHGALGHRVDVAGEAELAQARQQFVGEAPLARQPVDFAVGERERLEEVERLLESGRDQETALSGQLAHEQLEHRGLDHPAMQVGLQHRQLVQVGEQRAHADSSRAAR